MFPDTEEFGRIKRLTEKNDSSSIIDWDLTHVWVVVNHTLATQIHRSAKLKISHWIYRFLSLAYQFIFCQKTIVLMHFLLTHNRSMRCLFSVVNPVVVTILLRLTLLIA